MTHRPKPHVTIRVLHILNQLNPSGMERMLVSGAPYFTGLHCDSFVLGQGKVHSYEAELVAAGFNVRTQEQTIRAPEGRRRLRRLIREEGIDVVHIHTESNYLATVIATAIALRGRGVIVRTIHSVFRPQGRRFLTRIIQALIADRFVKHLIAPSPDVAENERRFHRSPRVILNWVDDRFFQIAKDRDARLRLSKRSTAPIAVIIGNCSKIKRHELAMTAVMHAGHNLFHVGSESGIDAEESNILAKLESRGNMMIRGPQTPDVALLEGDYFAMSSKNEGMSVALAEALVVGLPCYVADVPGLRWAAGATSVTVLPESQSEWNVALETFNACLPRKTLGPQEFDFSAKRGVSEYVETYRKA